MKKFLGLTVSAGIVHALSTILRPNGKLLRIALLAERSGCGKHLQSGGVCNGVARGSKTCLENMDGIPCTIILRMASSFMIEADSLSDFPSLLDDSNITCLNDELDILRMGCFNHFELGDECCRYWRDML